MISFVAGKTYQAEHTSNVYGQFTVTKRTAKFITVTGASVITTQRMKIYVINDVEYAYDNVGRYAVFTIRANRFA